MIPEMKATGINTAISTNHDRVKGFAFQRSYCWSVVSITVPVKPVTLFDALDGPLLVRLCLHNPIIVQEKSSDDHNDPA